MSRIFEIPFWFAYILASYYGTKMFCTQNEAMDPTFQIKYVPAF